MKALMTSRFPLLVLSALLALGFTQVGFRSKAEKAEIKRKEIREMRDSLLGRAFLENRGLKEELYDAEGYAVFSNIGVNVIFGSFAGGQGMVVDNQSGEEFFMNMGSAGLGLGIGVKDYRGLFVFYDRELMEDFVDKGWDFSGQADAAAKSGDKGGAANFEGNVPKGVKMFQFTENGLALQATVQATKYWPAKDLNELEGK